MRMIIVSEEKEKSVKLREVSATHTQVSYFLILPPKIKWIKYSQLNYNYNSMDVTIIIIRVIKNQSCNLSFLLSTQMCLRL